MTPQQAFATSAPLSPPDPPQIAARLLAWGAAQQRPLPWRQPAANGGRDPYRVWVSEVMLQQTQAAVVIPYYERWLARFPTVAALAKAALDDALKYWEGLGYYARARHLHRAAQIVMAQHGGQIPAARAALTALPGIGRSTAGAILSLAFGQRAALLDGNLKRVLSRLFDLDAPLGQAGAEAQLWRLSEALVAAVPHAGQVGALNEALMDLGASVCLPGRPNCTACPLLDLCLAQARGVQAARPVRQARKALPHFDVACGLIWRADGRLLIAQRPANGMLGGLWEFPGGKQEAGESLPECLRREIMEELGVEVTVGVELAAVEHTYTHLRITLHAFDCRWRLGQPQTLGVAAWAWVRPAEMARFALPATDLKIIQTLRTAGVWPHEGERSEAL